MGLLGLVEDCLELASSLGKRWLLRLGTPGLRWFQDLAVRAVLRH
jgi:hypothetical protein